MRFMSGLWTIVFGSVAMLFRCVSLTEYLASHYAKAEMSLTQAGIFLILAKQGEGK